MVGGFIVWADRCSFAMILWVHFSKSEEAKNYCFHMTHNTMTGNVKISWYEFECPTCKKSFTLERLEEINERNT